MKFKIGLFLDSKPASGGGFQYCQSILDAVNALDRQRFKTVVGYTNDLWMDYLEDKETENIKIQTKLCGPIACRRLSGLLPMKWWRTVSPYFYSITKDLLKQNCNLWIFPSQDTFTYLIPVPALGTIYDLMHRYEKRFPEVSAYGKYGSRERHFRNMCRWSQGVLVDSEIGKKHVLESYEIDPDKIHVLPFVAPKYISGVEKTGDIGNVYQLPKKFFFYPAQFWEHKNHKRLLHALSSLKDQHRDMMFVFVGSRKNGYQTTIQLAKQLRVNRDIKVLGYVPDSAMPQIYHRARALIMPTFFGPTNIPPLEAMALGCPVAVSDIYGIREQLGDAALYFNPASVEEMKKVMAQLWTDDSLCKDLAKKGLSQIARWNQRHFNRRLETILTNILTSQLDG